MTYTKLFEEFFADELTEAKVAGKFAGNYLAKTPAGKTLTIGDDVYTALGKGKWKGPRGERMTYIEVGALASAAGDDEVVYEADRWYKAEDFKPGDKILFQNGEEWLVVKLGMRRPADRRADDEITIVPHNKTARDRHVSMAIDYGMDDLNRVIVKHTKA